MTARPDLSRPAPLVRRRCRVASNGVTVLCPRSELLSTPRLFEETRDLIDKLATDIAEISGAVLKLKAWAAVPPEFLRRSET